MPMSDFLKILEEKEKEKNYSVDGDIPLIDPAPPIRAAASQPNKEIVKKYLLNKSPELGLETYQNPDALSRAGAASDDQRMTASIGSGINDLIRGATGFNPSNAVYDEMRGSADKPLALENDRQKQVRDYLKEKYLGGIKKTELENQTKILSENIRHNKEMEGIDRGKATASVMKDAQDRVQKQKEAVTEVEARKRSVESNIEKLKNLINEYGTYEAFGPENDILDALSSDIATDMAKLKDPTSTARESEVKAEMKNLVESGLFQRNSSAQAKLDALKERLNERVKNAYEVRGLAQPQQAVTPPPGATEKRQRPDGTWEYR